MRQVRLSQGLFAFVSEEDYGFVTQFKWCASLESRGTKFYAIRWITENGKRKKVRMHRAIIENRGFEIPPQYVVDHVNENSLDNRFENLEAITQDENMRRSHGWNLRRKKSG